jgi:hypothetical protein
MPHRMALIVLVFLALSACEAVEPEATPEPEARVALACESIAEAVVWSDDLVSSSAQCPWGRDCGLDEYLALPDLEPTLKLDLSEEQLDQQLADINAGMVPHAERISPEELGPLISEVTRLDVMMKGFTDRPLDVVTKDIGNDYSWRGEWEGYEPDMPYKHLLATDPLVGTFEVVVFRPPMDMGDGPFPAIVVAHGHGDNAWSHAARMGFGEALTQAGYVVVIPTFRASEGDTPETIMTRGLLRAGWSAMAVRMYETLLARRLAAALPEVDPCGTFGLAGHSGGSISSILTGRVAPDGLQFDAYLNDLTSTYMNWDPNEGWTLDETSPGLWPYSEFINSLWAMPMPTLSVGYGYPEGMEDIVAFYDDNL